MDHEDNSMNSEHQKENEHDEITSSNTKIFEDDTYVITDDESTADATSIIDADVHKETFNRSMSQDSLVDDEQDNNEKSQVTSLMTTFNNSNTNSKLKSSLIGVRTNNLDEHIKLVQQKKDEADELRLQRFQEQLRKKEQKWQQQQLVKVKKWLQLRNRDTDHRSQVKERRKKREEEAKVKIEEIIRREKEREQKTNSQIKVNIRGNASQQPHSIMSMSIDIHSTRRTASAPRLRSESRNMANRQGSNDSPITSVSQDNTINATTANNSHQLDPTDEQQRRHRSRHSYDTTLTNDDSSLSGTPRTKASSRARPMPTSYTYWLNSGDNDNHVNVNFMRMTYSATCRLRLSRSVERCPRACRAKDDAATNASTTNGELQRRVQSINRQHLNETILRLSKPKTVSATQSVRSGSTTPNGIPSSQSSYQLRTSTPPSSSNSYATSTSVPSKIRRNIPHRPTTASSSNTQQSNCDSQISPSNDSISGHCLNASINRQPQNRSTQSPSLIMTQTAHPKPPLPSSSKASTVSRAKPHAHGSLMTTSLSSSLVSTTSTHKQNIRRIGGTSPSRQKPKIDTVSSIEILQSQPTGKVNEEISVHLIEDDHTEETHDEQISIANEPTCPSSESSNIEKIDENANATLKREQPMNDEQEYQRKLSQRIREAQQRLELERQREEERKRQLELEEYQREQEQIRLAEEQHRAEQERLQRAIEARERENELKRQEELRLQQQREELEKKQAEEVERINRERQERIKKEEEERNERKRRLDLIMRRTRQTSPSLKSDTSISKTNDDETNGSDKELLSISHSTSDNRFPISVSTDNFLNNTITNESTAPDTLKFKSPLIQDLLNKARNTKSVDNISPMSTTTSQIMNGDLLDEETTVNQSSKSQLDSSDDDQHDSAINNTMNGHSDSSLSSSTNLNSSHDQPIEAATSFE